MNDDIKPIFGHHAQCALILTGMAFASCAFFAWHIALQSVGLR